MWGWIYLLPVLAVKFKWSLLLIFWKTMNNNIGNNIRDSAVISEDSSSEDDIDSSEDEGDCASTNGNYRDRRSVQW